MYLVLRTRICWQVIRFRYFGSSTLPWESGSHYWGIHHVCGSDIYRQHGLLCEAAAIDGATRLQRLFKITLPSIMPTIVMMFVLNVGLSFSTGFENILLLYMPSTYSVADTIYTYTYRAWHLP